VALTNIPCKEKFRGTSASPRAHSGAKHRSRIAGLVAPPLHERDGDTFPRPFVSPDSPAGTSDTALYGSSPDSNGWNWEITYVPSGKLGSWFPTWFNARLSLEYTMYNKFDGSTTNASDNNILFLLLWIAG